MTAVGELFDEMTLVVVDSIARDGGIPLPEKAVVIPLKSPSGRNLRRKISVLRRTPELLGAIRDAIRSADVVHTPLPGDIPFLGMMATLGARKRLIARYGSSWESTSETTWMNRLTRGLMRVAAGGRNVMLATGEGARPPARNMRWIFATALAAAELQRIVPRLERGLSQPPRFVYVGRLSPEKGVAGLLKAFAALRLPGGRLAPVLTVIGDGPQRSALERLAGNEDCADRVRFLGQLNRPALSEVLLESDVCIQPSLTEGFSKAWLDAMAPGLPVLASNVGAAHGVIGGANERGWLVEPGKPAALVGALQRIFAEPRDWPALRRRCREYAETRTLEQWSLLIGTACAEQWGLRLVEGKLRS